MKTFFLQLKKKRYWIPLVIVGLIVASLVWGAINKNKVVYTTEDAVLKNLKQTVEVTGTVESADDINLNFAASGRVGATLVKIGDQVKANQILARLSAGDVASQVADAQAALDVAKSNLAQLMAGASSEDINVTQRELENAKTTYQTALDSLANLQQTSDEEMTNYRTVGINTLSDKLFTISYALDIVEDAIMDNDADTYLFVTNVQLLNNSKDLYTQVLKQNTTLAPYIEKAKTTKDQADILTALDVLKQTLEMTSNLVSDTYDLMLVTVTTDVYTPTIVNSFKSSLNTQSSTLNTAITSVQTAASNITNKETYYQGQITAANNSVTSALNSLNLAQARLDLKKAPARSFEIDVAQANIRRAQATVARYYSMMSDTMIKAPVDGIVTKINVDVGEQSSASQAAISMIGLSNTQIKVDVPESDITKIKVGNTVDITLDAFGNDQVFNGTVTFIDPASTVISEVIYYKVTVGFNVKDEKIKSGMTANLTILTNNKDNVLVVPSRAVSARGDTRYVQVLIDDKAVEKEVQVGLKGDDGLWEITSGLNAGEKVIISTKNGKK
ncbi:MAG: efflux RND transporter periplasmic adaptor subunit [Patescibacteria group bacterium]|jgi:HlyD family secretion protein